jgi:hypothetical protein
MATALATPPEAPMSEPARIVNAFIAPTKTFSDLPRNASWWGPFALVVLVTVLYAAVMERQVGLDQISRNEIARSSRADQFDKLPADQKAKQIEISATITKVLSYGASLFALIAYLIMAGVLLGMFKLADAAVSFKVALAIVIYGSLPWMIHALLGVLSMLVGVDKEAFSVRNPVGTNPAYFMDPNGNKFVLGMASAFDVFAFWSIALIGIGFVCNSRVKRSTAIAIVAGMFFVYKLIGAGLASL